MKRLTRQELAELFGVSRRQVNVWLRQGCPCQPRRDGEDEAPLDAEAVARWRTERALAALGPRAAARPPFPALSDALRSADSFGRLVELAKEVAAGVCRFTVSLAQAAALEALLREAHIRLLRDGGSSEKEAS